MPQPPKWDYHKCKKDGKFVCNHCGTPFVNGTDIGTHAKRLGHPPLPPTNGETAYSYRDATGKGHICKVCNRSIARANEVKYHCQRAHPNETQEIEAAEAQAAAAAAETDCGCQITEEADGHRSHMYYFDKKDRKYHCKAPGCPEEYSQHSGAYKHYQTKHPDLEAKHLAEQAQSTSQDRPSSPNLPQLSAAQETFPGSSANIEDRLAGRTPFHNQQSVADNLIDPELLRLNSLGRRHPLTLRQRARYGMLYTA